MTTRESIIDAKNTWEYYQRAAWCRFESLLISALVVWENHEIAFRVLKAWTKRLSGFLSCWASSLSLIWKAKKFLWANSARLSRSSVDGTHGGVILENLSTSMTAVLWKQNFSTREYFLLPLARSLSCSGEARKLKTINKGWHGRLVFGMDGTP